MKQLISKLKGDKDMVIRGSIGFIFVYACLVPVVI
jgi:hypothetical protein